jgi:glucose/mannose-6-phosphate isomerase
MKISTIYDTIKSFPRKINGSYSLNVPSFNKEINRIMIFGMGGSYIAGLVFKQIIQEEIKLPLEVYPGYVPFLDNRTLIILISYSGNTKELINIYEKIKSENIVVITSGGNLKSLAIKNNNLLIEVPENQNPRFTISFSVFPLIRFFEKSGFIKKKSETIKKIIQSLRKNEKLIEKQAKVISKKLENKTPLIYATNYFYPAAYRIQTSLEEDVKIICHSNRLTELFHNEIEALPNNHYYPILLINLNEISNFKKQIAYFKKLVKKYYEFGFYNYSNEIRIFMMFYFADFLGYYLAKIKKTSIGNTPKSDYLKNLGLKPRRS